MKTNSNTRPIPKAPSSGFLERLDVNKQRPTSVSPMVKRYMDQHRLFKGVVKESNSHCAICGIYIRPQGMRLVKTIYGDMCGDCHDQARLYMSAVVKETFKEGK